MYQYIAKKSCQIPGKIVILMIRGYQRLISPWIARRCRFMPSCSHYALEAIQRFGLIKGGWLMTRRLLSCHPFHAGGYDPVPQQFKHRGDS